MDSWPSPLDKAGPIKQDTVVLDGLRTRIQVHGEGPPLLLIGGIWQTVPLWDSLLPHLAGFRTIAFDPPGIGDTEVPKRPYSIRRLAHFATLVLDAVRVERAHVLGISFGGMVAQQLMRSYPLRVDRAVLVSTTHGMAGLPGRPSAVRRILWPRAYGSERDLLRNVGVIFGGKLRDNPELVRQWHFRPPTSRMAALYRLSSSVGFSSLPWLHTIRNPILVVHGDDDPVAPFVNARVLASLAPTAQLMQIRGGGHLALLDSADDIAPRIREFLSGSR